MPRLAFGARMTASDVHRKEYVSYANDTVFPTKQSSCKSATNKENVMWWYHGYVANTKMEYGAHEHSWYADNDVQPVRHSCSLCTKLLAAHTRQFTINFWTSYLIQLCRCSKNIYSSFEGALMLQGLHKSILVISII